MIDYTHLRRQHMERYVVHTMMAVEVFNYPINLRLRSVVTAIKVLLNSTQMNIN